MGGGDLALGVADHRGRARTPQARQSRARETITAKRAGWTTSRRSSQAPLVVAQDLLAGTSRRRARAPARSASMCAAKTGEASSSSTRHARPLGALAGEEEDGALARRGRCPERGWRRSLARGEGRRGRRAAPRAPPPTATARCSKAARVVAREKATSVGSSSGLLAQVGGEARGLRRAGPARTWPRATSGIGPGRGCAAAPSARRLVPPPARRPGAGASSRITWALVPLMPKEETPARRGRPLGSHAARPRSAARPPPPPSRPWRRARRRAGSWAGRRRASPAPS